MHCPGMSTEVCGRGLESRYELRRAPALADLFSRKAIKLCSPWGVTFGGAVIGLVAVLGMVFSLSLLSTQAKFSFFGNRLFIGNSSGGAGSLIDNSGNGRTLGDAQLTNDEDGVICLGFLSTIAGNQGDDLLTGTDGPDVIAGRGGNDTIDGKGRDDFICGGSGDDFVLGGSGDDLMRGFSGDDFMNGGPDRDTMLADEGNDQVIGEDGRDFLSGNIGDDVLIGGDFMLKDERTEVLTGDDVFLGGLGNDVMIGDDGDDGLLAFSGNDFVVGGKGNDYINGFPGDDYMDGGENPEDECIGGDGADSAADCELMTEVEMPDGRRFPGLP
jgi:Ca2+-binding RTX toxin-like protein